MKIVSGSGCKQQSTVWDCFRYGTVANKYIYVCHVSVPKKPDEKTECDKSFMVKNSTHLRPILKAFTRKLIMLWSKKKRLKLKTNSEAMIAGTSFPNDTASTSQSSLE